MSFKYCQLDELTDDDVLPIFRHTPNHRQVRQGDFDWRDAIGEISADPHRTLSLIPFIDLGLRPFPGMLADPVRDGFVGRPGGDE